MKQTDTPGETVRLDNGRHVVVRRLRGSDGHALAAAFLRLSPASKALRFGAPPPFLRTSELRQLVDAVDFENHVAFVAIDDRDGDRLVGVGRLMRYADDPSTLDLGITVADAYQGLGLGRALVDRLARERPANATRIVTQVADGNEAALALLSVFGVPRRGSTDGEVVIDFSTDRASRTGTPTEATGT